MADIADITHFSDSDDDLSGSNDPPITIRSMHHSIHTSQFSRIKYKSKSTMKNNRVSSQTILIKANESFEEIKKKDDIKEELCDTKLNKYQRLREVKNIVGFIVNVHDATNFDIDLEIPSNLHEKYQDVISNQYTYQDLGTDFLESVDFNRLNNSSIQIGTTYRCRLRGVGINQLDPVGHTWKSNQICVEVRQLIDRTDGWVMCTLSDIDVYQRLLVDIVINTCKGPINLREYLLNKMIDDDEPIFYPYSGKRERNPGLIKH